MPRATIIAGLKVKVGKFVLSEKDLLCDGVYDETYCEVLLRGARRAVYGSINEAISKKNEWHTGYTGYTGSRGHMTFTVNPGSYSRNTL